MSHVSSVHADESNHKEAFGVTNKMTVIVSGQNENPTFYGEGDWENFVPTLPMYVNVLGRH
jgi:hypothetical protein